MRWAQTPTLRKHTRSGPKSILILAYTWKMRLVKNVCRYPFSQIVVVTKFRIRRLKPKGTKPSELGICTHFVAVSYCWSSSSAQKSSETSMVSEQYQVLEEDMKTVRPIRAPKDTIDRAVKFAAQNGFPMIWIDQVIQFPKFVILIFTSPNTVQRHVSSRREKMRRSLVSKRWTLCMSMRRSLSACSKQNSINAILTLCCYFSNGRLGRVCSVVDLAHSTSAEVSE